MLTKEAIEEFKELYKKQYGEELNDFVATEAANRLLRLVDAVYRPIRKDWEDEYKMTKQEQEVVPKSKKRDLVKHLVNDAKVTEFREKIGEKKFWELVRKANASKTKTKSDQPKRRRRG